MSDQTPVRHAGVRLEDADFSFARLHAPNFHATRITDGWFRGADISGDIEGLTVNGVLVEPLIEAELSRREPERLLLRAADPASLLRAVDMVAARWAVTVARARKLPAEQLDERVDGDWSFIETQRHLVLASDSWLGRMINGEATPWHPWGIAGSFLSDPAAIGLDYAARPTLDEVLAVRAERGAALRSTVLQLSEPDLARTCVPPPDGNHPNEPHSVLHCLHVIVREEWEHEHYAVRDLAILEQRASTA